MFHNIGFGWRCRLVACGRETYNLKSTVCVRKPDDYSQTRLLRGPGRLPQLLRRGAEEGVQEAGARVPPGPEQERGRDGALQGDQRGVPGAHGPGEAVGVRPLRPRRARTERRAGVRRLRDLRRVRRHLRRLLRRRLGTVAHVGQARRRPPAVADRRLRGGGLRLRAPDRGPAHGGLLPVQGRRKRAGLVADGLPRVRRRGRGPAEPPEHLRPVHAGVVVRPVPRRGQRDYRPVRELQRVGPGAPPAEAGRVDPGGHRDGDADAPERGGRAGIPRRARRGPLRLGAG